MIASTPTRIWGTFATRFLKLNLENQKVLIGRRQVSTVCGGGSRLRVCSTTIGSLLLLGDRATIATHGMDGTRRRRRSDHGDASRRLRSYLLLMLVVLLLKLLLLLLLMLDAR